MAATINPYNVYVRPMAPKKRCPCCNTELNGENYYSFGEYIRGKWRTIIHACEKCYDQQVLPQIKRYTQAHNRSVRITGYRGCKVENWMKSH